MIRREDVWYPGAGSSKPPRCHRGGEHEWVLPGPEDWGEQVSRIAGVYGSFLEVHVCCKCGAYRRTRHTRRDGDLVDYLPNDHESWAWARRKREAAKRR
jgi:hypothetical protein